MVFHVGGVDERHGFDESGVLARVDEGEVLDNTGAECRTETCEEALICERRSGVSQLESS